MGRTIEAEMSTGQGVSPDFECKLSGVAKIAFIVAANVFCIRGNRRYTFPIKAMRPDDYDFCRTSFTE